MQRLFERIGKSKFDIYRYVRAHILQWSVSNMLLTVIVYILASVILDVQWVLALYVLITGPTALFLINWTPKGYEVRVPDVMWTIDGQMIYNIHNGAFQHWLRTSCSGDFLEIGLDKVLFEEEGDAVALKIWLENRMTQAEK